MFWVSVAAFIVALVLCYRFRTVRILTAVLAILGIFFLPALNQFRNAITNLSNSETSIIDNYTGEYTVGANGNLKLVETLAVQFTEVKHGIFRYFDPKTVIGGELTAPVDVVKVERCTGRGAALNCHNEPYTTSYQGDELVAKIGSASVVYDAGTVNTYRITSTTSGVITQPEGVDHAQWYWNVVGAGWDMPMDQATVVAHLPAAPTNLLCTVGAGANAPCTPAPQQAGSDNTWTQVHTNLPARTPITWQAQMSPAGLTVVPAPGTPWWRSPIAGVVGVALALVLAALIWTLRERSPSKAPIFAAPTEDILPAVWTLHEQPADEPFQVMLLHLSELKIIDVTIDPATQGTNKKPDWIQLQRTDTPVPTEVTGADDLLDALDLSAPGSSLTITKDSVSVGKKVKTAMGSLSVAGPHGARSQQYYTKSWPGRLAHLFAALSGPLAILLLLVTNSQWLAAMFAIPAVVGIFSNRELATRLTDAGMAMRDQVSGLRTALSTPASVERFDYGLKARYFAQFLPWAVALACADEWATACAPPPGVDLDPSTSAAYYGASNMFYTSQALSTAVASVSTASVAAYAATQSSSSGGGGGGFSGGGGGGGGGGGSW